jgi:hypothetical protein
VSRSAICRAIIRAIKGAIVNRNCRALRADGCRGSRRAAGNIAGRDAELYDSAFGTAGVVPQENVDRFCGAVHKRRIYDTSSRAQLG